MYISRRDFIKQSAVAAVASGVATGAFAEETAFDPKNYEALRRQLRAYYPDECHGEVKDPLQKQSYEKIKAQIVRLSTQPQASWHQVRIYRLGFQEPER